MPVLQKSCRGILSLTLFTISLEISGSLTPYIYHGLSYVFSSAQCMLQYLFILLSMLRLGCELLEGTKCVIQLGSSYA